MSDDPAIIAIIVIWFLAMVSLLRGFVREYTFFASSRGMHALRLVADITPFMTSMAALTCGMYFIFSYSYTADQRSWGYAIVGTVIGYWLKGAVR